MASSTSLEANTSGFSRTLSFKKIIYRSLRRSKKDKKDKPLEFQIRPVSTDNLQSVPSFSRQNSTLSKIHEDDDNQAEPSGMCPLIQSFYKEGPRFDTNCQLSSYERKRSHLSRFEQKRRNHLYFVNDHRAKRELFCPEQASQCEIEIKSGTHHQFIVHIFAPNGERSGPIHFHGSGMKHTFSPTKVGCGHGIWKIEIHQRLGTKFQVVNSEQLTLRGAGVLTFEVSREMRLKEVERLWLDYLN